MGYNIIFYINKLLYYHFLRVKIIKYIKIKHLTLKN